MTAIQHRHGKTLGLGALTILGAGIAATWAWNRVAADLAGLPESTYVNGLAAALAVFALAAAAGFGFRVAAAAGRGRPE